MTPQDVPLVSIITPVYRAARFIAETVRSVQAQTEPRWEMLVVDDRSPDDTYACLQRAAETDRRIRPFRHEVNRGPAAARNTALEHARGRYIAFLDSDDLWLPPKLERQLAFMQERDATVSYTQYRRISETGDRVGRLIGVPERLSYHELLCNTAMATSTMVVDRIKAGPFHMRETYYDDLVLKLELLKRGHVGYGLQDDLMRYRVVARSWSRNKLASARWVWRTYRDIEHLSVPRALWCFSHYAWHGFRKYREF